MFLRHILAVLLLPFVVTIVVPTVILGRGEDLTREALGPPLLVAAGALSVLVGLSLMVRTIGLFHRMGKGTLAPWSPTRRLVVEGPYRHVRNPMISGVLAVLLGESALFASPALVGWFLFFLLLNALYIPMAEEPGLEKRFGEEYRRYKAQVPRWIPRLRPWSG